MESFCPLLQELLQLIMSGVKHAVFSVQRPVPRFLKHELHSVKKGYQFVKEYLGQIKKICDLLDASSYPVSAEEHTNIVLMGISQDFDSVVTVASFSLEPLALDQLIEILLECEMWQQ